MREILSGLTINEENVKKNLFLLDGRQCSEKLLVELTRTIGRQKAHSILQDLTKAKNFKNVFLFRN